MNRLVSEIRRKPGQSSVESLHRLGSVTRYLLRHGCALHDVSRELRVGGRVCLLALAFVAAPAPVQFRALVEQWNLLAVRSRLRNETPAFPF